MRTISIRLADPQRNRVEVGAAWEEPAGALRTMPYDAASQLITLSPPYSPGLASTESEMAMQPNLKSFMKFWTRQVPVAVPAADWYGVPSETESAVTIATAEQLP